MMKYSVMRRRREGVTNYHKRLKLLKSGFPRLVVRPSNKGITAQVVRYGEKGDKVECTVNERSLRKLGLELGGNSVPVSYLVGYAAGILAKKKKVEYSILDTGRYNIVRGGRISAALKGYVDAGADIPHDESIFPDEDRLNGKHLKNPLGKKLEEYRKMLEEKL